MYWPIMDPSSSLSSSELSVDTYRSKIWRLPPIVPIPMVRCNSLKGWLSLGSAILCPNIRPFGISLFSHWRMLMTSKCIFLREWHRSVSCVVSSTAGFYRVGSAIVDTNRYFNTTRTSFILWPLFVKSRWPTNTYQLHIAKCPCVLQALLWQIGSRHPNFPTRPIRICQSPAWTAHSRGSSHVQSMLEAPVENCWTVPENLATLDTVTID